MVTVTGTFDGERLVLDQVPAGIPTNTRLRITLETQDEAKPTGLAAIAAMAIKGGLPPDYAAQHHHYQYGVPKR